jgi:PAS domain-containing protein
MNNPLPVDPFNAADAVRRTWPHLIDAMLEAVWLVEPEGLRIVAANGAAGRLLAVLPADLVGRDMRDMASTPEDEAFWQGVAEGRCAPLFSESFVARPDGVAVPVTRRVSRVEPAPGTALYVVALQDRSAEFEAARASEATRAELQATLESISDGVLVIDLSGQIRNFNSRFASLWELPGDMLLLRADDEVFDWMRLQVADPRTYMQRLAEIDASERLQAVDRIVLRDGRTVERATAPQCSRGQPIGRVFSYRELQE